MKWFIQKFAALAVLLTITGAGMAAEQELVGAGATFPHPLYSKLFEVYSKENAVTVHYRAIGSGGGIRQLINKTVDFGGSDAVMSDEDIKAAGAPVLHIPICAGAVVLTYNLPGNPEVKFTPDAIADIFLGKIKKWNDRRITSQTPGLAIPELEITVVHRSDSSGTTNIFSDYLRKISKDWKEKVGSGTTISWPAGLGAKGNPGVAELVKQIPGSIGYVELVYALQNNMPYGTIQNRTGVFIRPSLTATSAAANIALPNDMKVSLTDTQAAEGYPIGGFTWILLYQDQKYGNRTEARAKALVNLVHWMTHEGQKYTEDMQYAPLSSAAVEKAEKLLRTVMFSGASLTK